MAAVPEVFSIVPLIPEDQPLHWLLQDLETLPMKACNPPALPVYATDGN